MHKTVQKKTCHTSVLRDCISMCFDICTTNIRVSIRVCGLHLVFWILLYPATLRLATDGRETLSAGEAEKAIVETSVAFLGFRCFATFACMLGGCEMLSTWI